MKKQLPSFLFKISNFKIIAFVFVGIFLMSISFGYAYAQSEKLKLDQKLVDSYTSLEPVQRRAKPTHIFIHWFVDTDVTDAVMENGLWTISQTNASHLAQSANPGENGNIIIYGHNMRKIMGNIRALTGKEIIRVTTSDGLEHDYRITDLEEVKPDQVEFLQPTSKETLTLYTCAGFWDRSRFIVQAQPI